MNTQRLSAQDLRAAAEAHHELGPEYSDAVLDSFLEKLESRLEGRLSQSVPDSKRPLVKPISEQTRSILSGMAVGGGAVGALLSLIVYDGTPYYAAYMHVLWLVIFAASISSGVAGVWGILRHRS